MRSGMVEQRQKLLPGLPANEFWRIPSSGALQYSPVSQNQRSRESLNDRIGKRLENDFRADSRRIAHGYRDNRFRRHGCEKFRGRLMTVLPAHRVRKTRN
jgi:hypothetical protein